MKYVGLSSLKIMKVRNEDEETGNWLIVILPSLMTAAAHC